MKPKPKRNLPIKDFQQLCDELGQGPFSILSEAALYAIKQMIRRAMEAGYWHGLQSAQAQMENDAKTKRRLGGTKPKR
jgi:hypothetical protein